MFRLGKSLAITTTYEARRNNPVLIPSHVVKDEDGLSGGYANIDIYDIERQKHHDPSGGL
jgi:hypothetical protein